MVLKVTPTKDPVDAGAIVTNAHFERFANALPESFDLGICKAVTSPERVETGLVQGFIRVNISQSGQEGLIQKERLQYTFSPTEHIRELIICKVWSERLGPQPPQNHFGIRVQAYPSKFPGVAETQVPIIVQSEYRVIETIFRILAGNQAQVAAHAQVDQKRVLIEWKNEVLAAPLDGDDFAVLNPPLEGAKGGVADVPRPVGGEADNAVARDRR